MKRTLLVAGFLAMFSSSGALACRVPIHSDATFYGMIISPPVGCKGCGRRFVVLDPKNDQPIRVIQLSDIALACYSPLGAVGEIGTLNVRGAPSDKELMHHSFLVGQKPAVSEQWFPKRKS